MPNIVTIKEKPEGLIVTEYTAAAPAEKGDFDLAGVEFFVPNEMREEFERSTLFGIFAGKFTVLSGQLAERFEAVLAAAGDRVIVSEHHSENCNCPPEMRHNERVACLERMFSGRSEGHHPAEG
jgi:hypothetical protein